MAMGRYLAKGGLLSSQPHRIHTLSDTSDQDPVCEPNRRRIGQQQFPLTFSSPLLERIFGSDLLLVFALAFALALRWQTGLAFAFALALATTKIFL